MIWSFNKGEWSEAYVFLKLLGDGRIFAGSASLEKIENSFLDIENIIRNQEGNIFIFERTSIGKRCSEIKCYENSKQYLLLPSKLFQEQSENLKALILSSMKGKIKSEEVQQFFEHLRLKTIKSPAATREEAEKYGGKTDIFITSQNSIDGMREEIGFSIKSHFGSAATLLNCGAGTKFVYRILNCTESEAIKINQMNTLKEQLQYIRDSPNLCLLFDGCKLIPTKIGKTTNIGPIFEWNLEHIDSRMSEILSAMLLCLHGFYPEPKTRKIPDIVAAVAKINPVKYKSEVGNPYETKFKQLLFAAFSGLTASKCWEGKNKVSGGYIDVAKNGDILYFRALSDDQFMSYLYNSTLIDSPSRGRRYHVIHETALKGKFVENPEIIKPDHGDYGYVYEEKGVDNSDYFIDINFQIRFIN